MFMTFTPGQAPLPVILLPAPPKVTAIEYIQEAVSDAVINASVNNISNVAFIAGDMKDMLSEELFAERGRPDVIITDPPRAGMHVDVVGAIRRSGAARIVYVSCNPATQARDIDLLSSAYTCNAGATRRHVPADFPC